MASGPITSRQIDGETMETVADFIFLGSKITADSDCSHEIKRCLLLVRKVMTNLDSILKSRDTTLSAKVHLVKAMIFPGVMYGCESGTIKKAERWRTDAFELWCWRRLLRVLGLQGDPTSPSWRKSVLNIYGKDWCWSWSSNTSVTWCEELTHLKRPWCWERLKAGEKGMTDDEMVAWHYRLNGPESEQAMADGEGQGSWACCSPWSHKELDMTERLNNSTEVWLTQSSLLLLLIHSSCVRQLATLRTAAHKAPLSMGFARQELLGWVAMPRLQGIILTQGSNLHLLCLLHGQVGSLPRVPSGKPD